MSTATLPRQGDWDLTHFFSEFGGADYRAAWKAYEKALHDATLAVRQLPPLGSDSIDGWVKSWLDWEELYQQGTRLGTFLVCLRSADSKHEGVNAEYAALQALGAQLKKFEVLLLDALRTAPDLFFEQLCDHPKLESARFRLQRMREAAKHQMTAELETLAAELEVDGMSAWGRLYDQVSGRLEFQLGDKKVPMSLKVSLLQNPDAKVRKQALVNSNHSWQEVEDVIAACLNAISGTRLTLYKRRGIEHFLEPALFDSAVSGKTLEAMMQAIASRYEVPRQYLRRKARILGKEKLGFQDLSAPLPLQSEQEVDWAQATERIRSVFNAKYPNFGKFSAEAFENRWIDYTPRDSKRMGGFCTSPLTNGESRIFMTFNKTLGDVQTLAHELGHAFHNHVMRELRPLNLQYPMTLAETASTFAETLLTDAILADPNTDLDLKASMLDTRLENGAAFLLNIPMRFHFEKRFYEERSQGEVSVSRLKELLLEAQRECYGDALAEDEMDPYFWASKLHFYITEVSFYNFPYSFGFLFSLGVYARALQEGADFFPRYEELLRLTGSDTAENVARRSLGVDLEQPQFWLDSIAMVEKDLHAFDSITEQIFARG